MRTSVKFGTLAALALAVACGDSTGPGALDQAEKTALGNALTASGALAGSPVAAYAALVVNSLEEVGHMSGAASSQLARDIEAAINASLAATEYDAVGLVIDFSVPFGQDTFQGAAAFVFGWNGLSTSSNSVSELVSAGLVNLGTSATPTGTRSIDGPSETQLATATYYERSTNSQYEASSGSVTVSSATFSESSQNCPGSEAQANVTCTFSLGTMGGQFAFAAEKLAGTGAETYTQSQINFSNLPAIRVSLTVSGQ